MQVGTSSLDVGKGTYYVDCVVTKDHVQIVISLCHALSDGPGALRVAARFLEKLRSQTVTDDDDKRACQPQPMIDLQSLILGDDYSGSEAAGKDSLAEVSSFARAVQGGEPWCQTAGDLANYTMLPPQTLQDMPHDAGFGAGAPMRIRAVRVSLSPAETSALRAACRAHGATVQGAISVASLLTRIELLSVPLPVYAVLQIPVNCRGLVAAAGLSSNDTCLCGSAGVVHTVQVESSANVWDLVRTCTERVRTGMAKNQPQEWLRRLLNDPGSLPPYSLMCSSIGVAPMELGAIDEDEEDAIQDAAFFGGALANDLPSKAQSTMLHAVSFAGSLQCTFNFTSPGIATDFAHKSAAAIKSLLVALGKERCASLTVSQFMEES